MAEPWRAELMVNKRLMWPAGHEQRLAFARRTGHSAGNLRSRAILDLRRRNIPFAPADRRTRTNSPDLEDSPCPTPSRSALPLFPLLPAASSWCFATTD